MDKFVIARPRNGEPVAAAYAAFQETRFFGSLDGLRALSILAVIWFHTVPMPRDSLLGQGNQGVTLFFAISGFLIVTLLLRAKQATGTFSLPQFWGRRILRIFPVYYAVLAAYGVLVWRLESDPAAKQAFFANVPAFATFTTNWIVNLDNPRVIFYFAWSLAAEEQFYLLWPFVERVGRGARPLLVAVGVLGATQALVWIAGGAAMREHLGLKMLTSVQPAILLGVVLAHLLHQPETFRRLWVFAGQRGSAFLAGGLALAALGLGPNMGEAGSLVIAVALTLLVATCVIREDNDLAMVLHLRGIAWIGTVSYGMYLLHMIAVNLARRAGAMAGVSSPYYDFAAGTAVALGLATLSYLTYERFFLKLKERWFGRVAAPRPAAPPRPAGAQPAPAGP